MRSWPEAGVLCGSGTGGPWRGGSLSEGCLIACAGVRSHGPSTLPGPSVLDSSSENHAVLMITPKIFYLHKDDLLLVDSDSVEYRRSRNSFSVGFFSWLGREEKMKRSKGYVC